MKPFKTIFCLFLLVGIMSSCSKEKNAPSAALDEFTIAGSASSAYFTTPNNATPAPENDQAKAFICLTDKRSYNWTQAFTDQSRMDFVLGTSYYIQSGNPGAEPNGSVGLKISSIASGRAWQANTNGRKISDFTHRSDVSFAHTTESYTNVTTAAQLDDAIAKIKADNFSEEDALIDKSGQEVIAYTLVFKTPDGRRGIIRLNNYNPYRPFLYEVSIKMASK